MGFTTVTFCAALLVLANAGPVYKLAALDENACALTCTDNNKFEYELGNVYEYTYNAKTTTKMNGASEDAATINMNAEVEIEPITKCDFVMRIKDASLQNSEDDQNSQAFKEAMMKQTLKFSFQDGRIDHICAMDGESTWTLNIKRGILSAFQNSMGSFDRNQSLTETDVVGTCLSEYKLVYRDGRTNIVEKTKNLLGCSDREDYQLAVQSIGYNVPSFIRSLPLMKSEYKCKQTVGRHPTTLQHSKCSGVHVFRPFSYGKGGAMTISEQTLSVSIKRKAEPFSNEPFNQRSTLLFHHQHDTPSKQESEEKIEAKLQELCQKATEDIRPEVPEMLNQLIEHMRQVDQNVLSRVYKNINQNTYCADKTASIKQFFQDAIPMVGTAASVGMIRDLISKKHVTGSEAEMWLLSLSFVHHPSKEMIAAATPLLGDPDVSGNALLAVSSLASSYCNVRPDCGRDSEISALIGKLMTLTQHCNVQNGDARKIVFALRALGNIGHSQLAVSHLTRCFTRRDVPEEIRIAAMDAFRRVPCDAMRSDLMGVFRDESEDSELRLNAYIALMKCPTKTVLSEVREVLEKEKSNQVGSFVWTHLTNLMETSDPHMQDIRNIVQDEELKKEFNLDQRKFSRNYEGSFFLDSINTGAKVDSNVIFSEKSFIPRSANLNLTIDLFGHAINFLEFGGRVQGMERILENFWGPAGTKMPPMKSGVPINFEKGMDDFRGSAFLRVFGNELRYWDDKSLNELQSSLRKLMNMQAFSFSKTMQLIDSRMIIPTCVGLPLNLTMSATGSISLDAKASFQRSEVNVNLKPSASVQVKGEMSVDAHVSRAGLKMVTVAHTSTGARLDIRNNKFKIQIPQKKMEIFNLKTDFYIIHRNTEKKQKMIVDNVHKHEICTGNLMKQVTGLIFCQNIKFPNASSHNEAPFFPFTGPVVYDLYMMNEDAPSGYQIEGFTKSPYSFYMDTPNSIVSRRIAVDTVIKNKNEAQMTFTAPWKNIKIEGTVANMEEMKKFTGKLSLNGRTGYTLNAELGMKNTKGLLSFTPKFEVAIPKKKMSYEGKIEVRSMKTLVIDMSATGFTVSDINLKVTGEILPKEIGLITQLKIGQKDYYIASSLGRLVSKSGFKYTPSLKITIPSRVLVDFLSEIVYESNKKMSFDFKLNKVLPKTVAMNAVVLLNAGKTKTKNILRVLFKSSRGSFRINGDVDYKKTGITSRVIGSYKFGAKYSDRLTLSSKIRDLSVKKSARYMGNVALTSKKQQFLNFNLKGQLAKAINHLETKFDFHYGNPKIKTNIVKFDCVLNRALKQFSHVYEYTMSIQHPGQKINYKVEANHVQSAKWPFKKIENKVMVQMAPGKVVQTKLSYNNAKVKGLSTIENEISLSYPGRDMKITDKLTQVNKNTYENNCIVQWQKGQEVVVQSTYTKTSGNLHNIENTLRLSNKKEVKATAMLQVMPGAYKAKAEFSADNDVIYRQQINYKVEGGVTYAFNAKQISSGAIGEIMWAPNQKVAANINFNYVKKSSLSGKVAFSTPFNVMKNFDSEAKFTWANSKYASMISVSWNNQSELKQDVSFAYPDFHLSYDASALLSGKKYGVSLSMKYNNDVSSIDMNYSSPLKNYRNGKMTIETRRNLPKMLKTKMELTHNGKSIFNINANYGYQKDNIDMKIDITEPNGQKITVSANINLSGSRKTVNVELKSRYINLSAGGAFEYQGTRSASGELKLTAERKSVVIRADYKKEGSTYKVTGTLGLPDGRSLKMEGSLDLQNIAASLKTMSPDFPELTEIDMAFSFNGDKRMFNSVASLKVMPYFDTTQVEMKFTRKQFSIEMKTPFESMKLAKATFTLAGEKVKAVFQLNNERMVELDMNYHFTSINDFVVSMTVLTSHRRYKEFQFDLMSKGPLSSMQSSLKVKFANVLMLDAIFQNSRKVSKVSLDAQLMDFDEFKSTFELKGNLDDLTAKLITSIAKKEVNRIDVSLKEYGRLINVKVNGPNAVNFDFDMKLDTQAIAFDMASTFTLNGRGKYEMSASYEHLSKLLIKSSIPSYQDELLITFSGTLKTFNMQTKFSHNNQMYELMLSNQEYYRQVKGILKTPYFQDTASFRFDGGLREMNIVAQVMHNNDKFELTFSSSGYYQQIDVILETPYFQPTLKFSLIGNLKRFNFEIRIKFDKQIYEMKASNENYFQQMKFLLNMPFFNFQFEGDLNNAEGTFNVLYGNTKYEVTVSNQEIRLSLPKWLKNLKVKLNGNWRNFEFIVQVMNYADKRFEISATNKNFREIKAHLSIPDLDDIDFLVKTSGILQNGEISMKMLYGENVFENKVEFSLDGRQASFEIEPHYMILGRSGKAKLQMDLMFEAQSFKYEFEADVEGTEVKSMASVKISPEISVLMTVNIPTLDASEMKLRIVSRGFQKTDIVLNLKSPWTGMTNIFYEHNGQMGKMFSTKGYIERDGVRLAGYSLDTDFSGNYSFDFTCDYDDSKNKIETKGDLKFQGGKTVATLSINTPFRVFKEFFASAQIKSMRDGQIKAELDVKIPNQQYSFNFDLGNGNFNGLLNLNMDKKNKDKQYQFQTTYKNTDQRADVSRSFNFKIALPQRTVSLDSRFENTQHSIAITGDLTWDEAKDQKVGFKLMVQKGEQKEAKLQIITPRRTVEIFGRVGVNGNQYSTVGHIMMDENNQAQKVDISANMMISSDRRDIDFTVKFPNQKKGMNLKTIINLRKGDLIFSSTSEFSMDQDPKKSFKMSTKLMSETKGKRQMYTLQMDAKHPESGFDTEMVGRVSSSPEKYNADVEIGYLNSKNKQQKFAIRGEVHRFNRDVNLKLEVPSKTIELDGSLRTGSRYMVSVMKTESGKENMEALFKLNPKSQRMSIITNVDEKNPQNLYRIEAGITKSKATLKACRTDKSREQLTDGRITVELKRNNLFQTIIKWNPDFPEDINLYGYPKLVRYGKELKSFGDYLNQVLNEEVSMKFSLAKQSFSEDMTPIIDYFTTEYRSLSVDFARAMRYMNQMFQQDSFYVKSAIEAISKVWGEMWLNYNKYLIELKQEMEVFNRDMNKKMNEAKKQFDIYYDQYSVQLKNRANGAFAYCQEQYKMLYVRTIEMEARVVSFMKNYPKTIEELINRIRQNPYGEEMIDLLMEMHKAFNKKAKEHMDTLTSSIYSAQDTLNRHINSARRYPIVDDIMEAVNKIYQKALWSYNFWDIKNNLLELKDTLYKFGSKKIKEIKNIITDVGMSTFIFDPERGEIIVDIRFGAAKYFYNHFMSSVEDTERAVMKLKNLMPSFNLNVWDIYYMMKPSTDPEDYIPPFKAEAILFAGHHITTFDGHHLIYKGTCSYLLARDFVDGNFTVVANFNADRKSKTLKSLSVTTAHRERLEIFPDNKVSFNGRVAKLPLQLTDATVTLQDNVIVVESKRGYKVMCDHNLQLYTVQISGWYFNKVAGLFGNYNNEPKDDMLMSNNKYTNDLEQFAQSWSVSRQCKSHRSIVPSHMVTENKECAQFFLQTDSPFRYCFRQVNPDQFYKTCAVHLSSSRATSIDLCNVTSFYQKKCEKKGIYLTTPIMCTKEM